jgi:chorismate--pyruvate lyase
LSSASLSHIDSSQTSCQLAQALASATWLPVAEFIDQYAVSQATAHWLVDIESLTERLQMHTDDFSVRVLYQGNSPLMQSASGTVPEEATEQMRNVELKHGAKPWVFASSLLPAALCVNEFSGLGTKPLGKILFNDARFSRQPFELVYLSRDHLFAQHYQSPHDLVGRRSAFHFLTHTLWVTEIFLPGCPAYHKV